MRKIAVSIIFAAAAFAFVSCGKTKPKPAGIEGWDLVFQDEFDGTELNTENWGCQKWKPGTVNSELQAYTDDPENVYVKDGNLVIQALNPKKNKYTSGRLITYQKQEFKYGRFEARIKIPKGKGFLPAFWLLGKDNYYGKWPRCGEIDIMEILGSEPKKLHCTIHYGSDSSRDARQRQVTAESKNPLSSDFHVYACEWEPGEIRFYLDDELVGTQNEWYSARNATAEHQPYPAPFDKPMYMILNLAVGGDWPGDPDEKTKFGKQSQMVVDYVRVYQKQGGYEEMEAAVRER